MPKEWRASKTVKLAAKELRRGQTPMERRLWEHLRYRRLGGLRFRRLAESRPTPTPALPLKGGGSA